MATPAGPARPSEPRRYYPCQCLLQATSVFVQCAIKKKKKSWGGGGEEGGGRKEGEGEREGRERREEGWGQLQPLGLRPSPEVSALTYYPLQPPFFTEL